MNGTAGGDAGETSFSGVSCKDDSGSDMGGDRKGGRIGGHWGFGGSCFVISTGGSDFGADGMTMGTRKDDNALGTSGGEATLVTAVGSTLEGMMIAAGASTE